MYYCPTLEAICWRDTKNKFPKPEQILHIKEINLICTSTERAKSIKRLTTLKIEDTLYFSIESKDRSLDLLAPNIDTKNLWIKTLNVLILLFKNREELNFEESLIDFKEFEKINNQFNENIKDLSDESDQLKEINRLYNDKLKKSFVEVIEAMIKKEKNQFNQLDKCYKELNREFQSTLSKRDELQKENIEILKELDDNVQKNKDLANDIKCLKDDKASFHRIVKEIQRKLVNYTDYIGSMDMNLDFNSNSLDVKMNERTSASFDGGQSKYDINMLNSEIQNNFDIMILKSNEIHKSYIKIREEVKQQNEFKKIKSAENENLNKKYNDIWNLHHESLKEKEKLYNQIDNANQNFKLSNGENTKMKNDLKNLENQMQQLRNEIKNKEKEIENMMVYSKKIKNDMEKQIEEIRKEADENEMKKLSWLEERFVKQIQKYENKILEDGQSIKEMDDLVKNYQNKTENKKAKDEQSIKDVNQLLSNYERNIEDYILALDKQQLEIEELKKLNHNLTKMADKLEENLRTKEEEEKYVEEGYVLNLQKREIENKNLITLNEKLTKLVETLEEKITAKEREENKIEDYIVNLQKIEIENKKLMSLNQNLTRVIQELEENLRAKEEEKNCTEGEYIICLQKGESENKELNILNQNQRKIIKALEDKLKVKEDEKNCAEEEYIIDLQKRESENKKLMILNENLTKVIQVLEEKLRVKEAENNCTEEKYIIDLQKKETENQNLNEINQELHEHIKAKEEEENYAEEYMLSLKKKEFENKELTTLNQNLNTRIQELQEKTNDKEKDKKCIEDYAVILQKKESENNELTKLNQNLTKMIQDLHMKVKSKQQQEENSIKQELEIEGLYILNKNLTKTIQAFEENLRTKEEEEKSVQDYVLNLQKREIENKNLITLNEKLTKLVETLEEKITAKEREENKIEDYIVNLQKIEIENKKLMSLNQNLTRVIQELEENLRAKEEEGNSINRSNIPNLHKNSYDDRRYIESTSKNNFIYLSDPISENEIKKYKEQFQDMEIMIETYTLELQKLEQENIICHQKLVKYRENEEQYISKISKLQYDFIFPF